MTLSDEFQCLAALVPTLFQTEDQNTVRGLPLLFNVHIIPKFNPASLNVEQILKSTKVQAHYKSRYHTCICLWNYFFETDEIHTHARAHTHAHTHTYIFPTSRRIKYVTITKTYKLMLFRAVLTALCANNA